MCSVFVGVVLVVLCVLLVLSGFVVMVVVIVVNLIVNVFVVFVVLVDVLMMLLVVVVYYLNVDDVDIDLLSLFVYEVVVGCCMWCLGLGVVFVNGGEVDLMYECLKLNLVFMFDNFVIGKVN